MAEPNVEASQEDYVDEPTDEVVASPEELPVASVQYLLTNVTRGRNNRTARVAVPGRIPFVQRIAGGRIIVRRARPARITEAVLKANLPEIAKLVALQTIVVKTLDGKVVDLETLGVAKTVAPPSPPPNPPLDSAKNDKNEGVGYNVPGSPEGTTLDSDEPELLRQSALTSPEEEASPPEPEPEPEPTPVVAAFVNEDAPPPPAEPVAEAAPEPSPEPAPDASAEAEEEGEEEGDDEGEDEPSPEPTDASAPAAPAQGGGKKKRRKKGRK